MCDCVQAWEPESASSVGGLSVPVRYAATCSTHTGKAHWGQHNRITFSYVANIILPHDSIHKIEFERFILQLREVEKEYLWRSLVWGKPINAQLSDLLLSCLLIFQTDINNTNVMRWEKCKEWESVFGVWPDQRHQTVYVQMYMSTLSIVFVQTAKCILSKLPNVFVLIS